MSADLARRSRAVAADPACPAVASFVMDLWAAIAEERASILETFEGLSPEQWDTPSLCGQWTVRQVLGHLVIAADPPRGRFLMELAKGGGSFDKANARLTGPGQPALASWLRR